MPCWEVRTVSVRFKVAHKDLLLQALRELGWSYTERGNLIHVGDVTIDLEGERVECPKSSLSGVNKLRQKYSEVVLKKVAAKRKWGLREVGTNKFKLRRWA